MRADMCKVLAEHSQGRFRSRLRRARKGYKRQVTRALWSEDGGPSREPTMRMVDGYGGWFGGRFGPLRKFLDANVGRPWDKVYSEICRQVGRGNGIREQVMSRLFYLVVIDVKLVGGEPYRKTSNHPLRQTNCWYVCPKSGLLRRVKVDAKRERWQSEEPSPPLGWVSKSQFVRRGLGGWELVAVKPWPDPHSAAFDVLFRQAVSQFDGGRWEGYYGKRVYAVWVRPLGEAELADLPVTLPGKLKSPNVVR